ncbi:MAG TPA: UDP-N-acetylmuramate dehydrogenase [Woeseiaceae bacterium]|nr:UDP-N-acetylmuramate dehydrogenase [Woeseiaceae bacterium]
MSAALTYPAVRGELRRDEPFARHTSWRVGGPAELWFRPADLEDLSQFLRELDPATPVFWYGLGSNLLVRDGGLEGAVIAAAGVFRQLERSAPYRVRSGTSVPCTQLARQCIRWGVGPSEFFAGIPGTVGGALAMNAGAHGGETWERVLRVRTIDRRGEVHERDAADYSAGYRQVAGPAGSHIGGPAGEWFVEATFEFDPDVVPRMETLKAMLARRKETQPLGLPSCGSVFRNPPGDHAARLIETAGLKGHRVGGAEVSGKHANFIINREQATAADIETLIEHVQATVARVHGVELVHEVRIVGEEAA